MSRGGTCCLQTRRKTLTSTEYTLQMMSIEHNYSTIHYKVYIFLHSVHNPDFRIISKYFFLDI